MAEGKVDASVLLRTEADTHRPLIHHLNADTSWLIQLPRNDGHQRVYFNVLVDAWLTTPQVEYHRIFHQQEHTVPSAFQTIAEVETYVHEIEVRACSLRGMDAQDKPSTGYIDVAACALRGTDHVNEHTLRQLHPSVPVLVRHDAERFCQLLSATGVILVFPSFQTSSELAVSPRQTTFKAFTRASSSHSTPLASNTPKQSYTRHTVYLSNRWRS
jgi:hypothetical protein